MGGHTYKVATSFAHWRVSIEEKKNCTVKKMKITRKKMAEEEFEEQMKGMALRNN